VVVQKNDDAECYQTVDNVSKESNSALVNTKTSSYNLLDKKNSQNTNSSQVFIFAQSLALPSIDFSVKQIVFLCVDNRLLTSEQNQLNKFV
jgi:CRISPR/Cas system CMR-associated protein Cmr1 (group 7 of RAMP superfamily)